MKIKNNLNGFTLVELMVVMSVSVMLISTVVVSLNKYYGREKVSLAATRAVSMIDLARSYAITNQAPSGFTGLDYVSITLTSSGKIAAYPVNNLTGTGPSYFSENLSTSPIIASVLTFGSLNFAAGNGKLVYKDPSPSFLSHPSDSMTSVGITLSSIEINPDSHQLTISPFGGVNNIFMEDE